MFPLPVKERIEQGPKKRGKGLRRCRQRSSNGALAGVSAYPASMKQVAASTLKNRPKIRLQEEEEGVVTGFDNLSTRSMVEYLRKNHNGGRRKANRTDDFQSLRKMK